jgi:16S rRNA (cytidine1402-2'-O)-methyltransferase
LGDITLRALEVLRRVDAIAAEDTRRTRRLLDHFDIEKPLYRLDAHTIRERGIAFLEKYTRVAFVSDAGTPGISDPGADLVRLALELSVSIEVLPGATAFVPALILSGLRTDRFRFEGFLPRKGSSRRRRLKGIAQSEVTALLYESPSRVVATLIELKELCGPQRRASISRELTKRFETTYRGTLEELCDRLDREALKGEVVIVIAPADPSPDIDYRSKARELAAQGVTGRSLRAALMDLGAPRNTAYELSLSFDRDIEAL